MLLQCQEVDIACLGLSLWKKALHILVAVLGVATTVDFWLGEKFLLWHRLLRRAQAAQNKFYTEAYGYGRGGSHKAEEAFVVLGEVIGSLVNHR